MVREGGGNKTFVASTEEAERGEKNGATEASEYTTDAPAFDLFLDLEVGLSTFFSSRGASCDEDENGADDKDDVPDAIGDIQINSRMDDGEDEDEAEDEDKDEDDEDPVAFGAIMNAGVCSPSAKARVATASTS